MRRPWVRLLLLGLLLGFAFQGSRGLWGSDEGRYTDGALQMLESGNYLIPAYSPNRVNLAKPPMVYWLIAGSVSIFGHNTWAVRLPYACAFVITILLLYAMGCYLVPAKPWLPGLLYACALVPFIAANAVSTDVFLTLFEAMAALGFVRFAFRGRKVRRRGDTTLMWLGFGLAFLTKGPPGLVLLLAAIPFVVVRDGWRALGEIFRPADVGLFLLVGLTWYGLVVAYDPWAFHYFLHRQVYQRLFTGVQHRHAGAFGWVTVYVPTLVLGSLPWWPLAFRPVRTRFNTLRRGHWLRHHWKVFFLLLWIGLPLLVFCLAQSRLPLYVLPLFLPLSLLLAIVLQDRIDLARGRQRILIGVWIAFLLVFKGGVAYWVHAPRDQSVMAHQLVDVTHPASYGSLVFVDSTSQIYRVDEHTPWGLTLYLHKPVYGIAWAGPGGSAKLCRALDRQRTNLLLLDASTVSSVLQSVAHHCHAHTVVHVGTWRGRTLERVQSQGHLQTSDSTFSRPVG